MDLAGGIDIHPSAITAVPHVFFALADVAEIIAVEPDEPPSVAEIGALLASGPCAALRLPLSPLVRGVVRVAPDETIDFGERIPQRFLDRRARPIEQLRARSHAAVLVGL